MLWLINHACNWLTHLFFQGFFHGDDAKAAEIKIVGFDEQHD